MLKYFLILILVFVSLSAGAQKKELLLLGGGGEPPGEKTIFDTMLKNLHQFKQAGGYSVTSAFDGDHPQSQKLNTQLAGAKAARGRAQDFRAQVAEYERKIQSGALRKGDQLLITVATHGGAVQTPRQSHPVATTDGTYPLSELIKLRNLAEAKGVKLAIIDGSCHSGATLDLGTDKTCVVTAANTNVGYINAGDEITANLRPGRSLEDAFLASRRSKEGLSPGAPQISSPAGKNVYGTMSVLTDSQIAHSTLDRELKSGLILGCKTSSAEYLKFTRQIDDVVRSGVLGEKEDLEALKAKNLLKSHLDDYNTVRMRAAVAFRARSNPPTACLELLQGQKPVCANYEVYERQYEAAKERLTRASTPEAKRLISVLENLRNSSKYKAWLASVEEYEKLNLQAYYKATYVNKQERVLYDYLYKAESAKNKQPNPCKDFVL